MKRDDLTTLAEKTDAELAALSVYETSAIEAMVQYRNERDTAHHATVAEHGEALKKLEAEHREKLAASEKQYADAMTAKAEESEAGRLAYARMHGELTSILEANGGMEHCLAVARFKERLKAEARAAKAREDAAAAQAALDAIPA